MGCGASVPSWVVEYTVQFRRFTLELNAAGPTQSTLKVVSDDDGSLVVAISAKHAEVMGSSVKEASSVATITSPSGAQLIASMAKYGKYRYGKYGKYMAKYRWQIAKDEAPLYSRKIVKAGDWFPKVEWETAAGGLGGLGELWGELPAVVSVNPAGGRDLSSALVWRGRLPRDAAAEKEGKENLVATVSAGRFPKHANGATDMSGRKVHSVLVATNGVPVMQHPPDKAQDERALLLAMVVQDLWTSSSYRELPPGGG